MKKLFTLTLALIITVAAFTTSISAEEYLDTDAEIVTVDWNEITKEYFAMSMDFVSMYSLGSEYGNGCVGFFLGSSDATYALFVAHDTNSEPCFAFNKNGDWGGTWQQNRTYLSDLGIDDEDTVNLTIICRKADGVFEASAYINGTQVMLGSDTVGTYVDESPLDFSSVGLACKLITSSYTNITYAESDSPITYEAFKNGTIGVEEAVAEEVVAETETDTADESVIAEADTTPEADEPAAEVSTAPQTFDAGIIAAVTSIISLAGFVAAKKKR